MLDVLERKQHNSDEDIIDYYIAIEDKNRKKSIDVEIIQTFFKHISKIRFFETHGNAAFILSVNIIFILSRF